MDIEYKMVQMILQIPK